MLKRAKIMVILALLSLCWSAWAADVNDPNLIGHWKLEEGAGTVAYDSAGTNDGNLIGDPNWVSGKIGGALDFNGVNDYVKTQNNVFTNAQLASGATLCAWFKTKSANYGIFADDEGYAVLGINHPYAPVPNKLFGIVDGGDHRFFSSSDVNDNFWHHAAIVWNGAGTAYLYLDGVEVSSGPSGPPTPDSKDRPFTIGVHSNISGHFEGTVDDVRVYKRALSAEEIWQLYYEGLTYPERAIIELKDAINEKTAALINISEALTYEYTAFGLLGESLLEKDYGDLSRQDIAGARRAIRSEIRKQQRCLDTFTDSIDVLEQTLIDLGWEPGPNEPDPNQAP